MPSGIAQVGSRTFHRNTTALMKWAEDNGLDPHEVRDPCTVDFDRRVIVADHIVSAEEGRARVLEPDEVVTEQRVHPLLVDPPEEICL